MPAKIAKIEHMHAPLISDRPPLKSLLRILLVIVLFGWTILGQVLGVVVAALVYDGNLMEALQDPINHPDLRNTLLLSQFVAAFTGFIFMPWYYLKVSEGRSLAIFFRKELKWPLLAVVILIAVVGLGIVLSPVVEWNAGIQFPDWMAGFGNWAKETEKMAEALIESLTANLTPVTFIVTLLVVAILPALGEEIVFRGLIQTELMRALKNPHVAILIAAIFFSAFHLQFLGFVPRLLIGMFLGYLYYWSGNLWITVLGHFFNNGLQLTGLYLYQKGVLSFDMGETDNIAPWPLVGISLVLTLALLVYLKNYFQSRLSTASDVPQPLQ